MVEWNGNEGKMREWKEIQLERKRRRVISKRINVIKEWEEGKRKQTER